jgi:hypothetical protein
MSNFPSYSHQIHAARRSSAGVRRRTLLSALLAGLVAAALVAPMTPALAGASGNGLSDSGQASSADSASTSPLWGLGVSNSAVDPGPLQSDMGKSFQAQGEYTPLSGWSYPFGSVLAAKDAGARIYLNINSWHVVGGKKVCYPFKNYASGTYDSMLQNWVNELQAFNYDDTFITFTHEPTAHSPQQPSCGTGAEYDSAYDYVYHYFRDHGVTYPFVWWMVASSFRNGYAVNWQPPATDFSVVAVDGYNRFYSGFWRAPEYIFTAAHDYAASLDKPLMIGEVGSVEDRNQPQRKAEWITDAANLFASWNTDSILWNDTDTYKPDSTTPSLNAWVAASEQGGSSPFVANVSGVPGGSDTTWFSGFQPSETVSFRMDSTTGPYLGQATADSSGSAQGVNLTLPTQAYGGAHVLVAIGQSSGLVAQGTATLSPVQPGTFDIAQGDTWTFNAVGWGPNEPVTATFPGGTPATQLTDDQGSATIPVVSPAEPYGGGYVQITSPSYSMQVHFRTDATLTMGDTGEPQGFVPAALTGYGANEVVGVKVPGGASLGSITTDANGDWSGNVLMNTTFGRKTILFTGATSRVQKQHAVVLGATLALSPSSGPTGTVVTVTSGPGWVPGETVHVFLGGTQVGNAIADSSGQVTALVTITQHQAGGVAIRLSDSQLGVTASGTFTLT